MATNVLSLIKQTQTLNACLRQLIRPATQTLSCNTLRLIPHMPCQQALRTHHTPHKRLRHHRRALRRRMRMVVRIERVHNRGSELLKCIRSKHAMVHELCMFEASSRRVAVGREARAAVLKAPRLPRIVGRRTCDHDPRAQLSELLCCVLQIGWVGEDALLDVCVTRLCARACAVRASVVAGSREGAAIIVAELDDDKVFGFDERGNFSEARLIAVASRRTASAGFVDDGDGEGVVQVFTPACDGQSFLTSI